MNSFTGCGKFFFFRGLICVMCVIADLKSRQTWCGIGEYIQVLYVVSWTFYGWFLFIDNRSPTIQVRNRSRAAFVSDPSVLNPLSISIWKYMKTWEMPERCVHFAAGVTVHCRLCASIFIWLMRRRNHSSAPTKRATKDSSQFKTTQNCNSMKWELFF